MSGDSQRGDQIAYHLFTKLVLVVDDARSGISEVREEAKTDKWFNLETSDTDVYKEKLRHYKSISQLGASPPPLEVQILLTVPDLTNNQVLVQHPPNASRVRVEPTPSHILLESWRLVFNSSSPPSESGSSSASTSSSIGNVALPTVYKHAMSVFRSLYTLLRVLPTWRISRRLRRRPGTANRNGNLGIAMRVNVQGVDSSTSADTRYLGFDAPLSSSTLALQTESYTFDSIQHPMGVFSFAVTYLSAPYFEIDTVEALLSSRFLSLDTGPPFTPTLARNTQRESVLGSGIGAGSPGSLPMRTSLPRSPPSSPPNAAAVPPRSGGSTAIGAGGAGTSTMADRFVLPATGNLASASRTSFPSLSPRSRNVPLPAPSLVQRSTSAQAAIGPGSLGSAGSSSRHSREEGRETFSSVSSRGRRESLGMGRGSDVSSAQGALPIRRPSTTVNPFKSSTLSSGSPSIYSHSPSLRHGSPATGPTLPSLPTIPSRPGMPPSPTSSRAVFRGSEAGVTSPLASGRETSLGMAAFHAGSSPVLPLRPSPPTPFAPSSLGERRIISSPGATPGPSAEGSPGLRPTQPLAAPPRRKRYSSSFGYRYGVAGSDGSGGSAEKGKEPERAGASYLSANTDDDDITAFMQDIEARKPLGGGFNSRHDRERTLSEAGAAPTLAGLRGLSTDAQERERRNRTVSEGPAARNTSLAALRAARGDNEGLGLGLRVGAAAETLQEVSEPPTREPSGGLGLALEARPRTATAAPDAADVAARLDQLTIDERLRELTDKYRASMEGIDRRSGSESEAGAGTSTTPDPPPSAGRMRPPSLGGSPLRPIIAESPGLVRRVASTPGGTGTNTAPAPGTGAGASAGAGTNYNPPWTPRGAPPRRRADSGSGASVDSGGFYGQSRAARGSAASVGGASVGSEEVVGRLEMER